MEDLRAQTLGSVPSETAGPSGRDGKKRKVPEGGSLFFQTTAEAYLKMTDEQKNRYDDYRSSTVGKVTNMGTTTVDRLVAKVIGVPLKSLKGSAGDQIATIVRSSVKLFAGELIERARLVAFRVGDDGPIKPEHLRQAYFELDQEGKIPSTQRKKKRLYTR